MDIIDFLLGFAQCPMNDWLNLEIIFKVRYNFSEGNYWDFYHFLKL